MQAIDGAVEVLAVDRVAIDAVSVNTVAIGTSAVDASAIDCGTSYDDIAVDASSGCAVTVKGSGGNATEACGMDTIVLSVVRVNVYPVALVSVCLASVDGLAHLFTSVSVAVHAVVNAARRGFVVRAAGMSQCVGLSRE